MGVPSHLYSVITKPLNLIFQCFYKFLYFIHNFKALLKIFALNILLIILKNLFHQLVYMFAVYLKTHSNPFSQCSLWEGCLNTRHCCTLQNPTFRSNLVTLLFYPRHNSKVLGEILGNNSAYPLFLQLFRTVEF